VDGKDAFKTEQKIIQSNKQKLLRGRLKVIINVKPIRTLSLENKKVTAHS